jgi:hypothetical protein
MALNGCGEREHVCVCVCVCFKSLYVTVECGGII